MRTAQVLLMVRHKNPGQVSFSADRNRGDLPCFYWFLRHTVLDIWHADWLQDQGDRLSLEASAHVQPWNAGTHWLLGRYSSTSSGL